MDYSPEIRRLDRNALCPFYSRVIPKLQRQTCGIECESLMDRKELGFYVRSCQMFTHWAELNNYHDIFCSELYQTCPYYKAMLETKYKEQ